MLYSSSYDKGEGWTSADIATNGIKSFTFPNLFVYNGGPEAKFKIAISGNAIKPRRYKVTINSDSVLGKSVDFFNYSVDSTNFPLSILSSNNAIVAVTNKAAVASDRMVVHQYEIIYPRQFNFGNAKNFEFGLPANNLGSYLEIKNFSNGSVAPVLYDLANGKSYVGDVSTPSIVKFLLEPSATDYKLVLVNQETSNINPVISLQARSFTNFSAPQNTADYLIISHPTLMTSGNNAVEEYRQYRSSIEGGSHNAKIFSIDDLVDQFAFGIKMHPASIRNFLLYARNNFPSTVKNVFLIGKGVAYTDQRTYESNPDINKLNLVPTFGYPASDVLLSADPGDGYPKIPIGRLSVISAEEVGVYLKKVKEHELSQRTMSPYIRDKAWTKNVAHIVGASEPTLQSILDNYMTSYKNIIEDTLFGANVTTFTKSSPNAVEQVNNGVMDKLFEQGLSLITYFGHSSASTLEFNLNNPDQYQNQGKYPLFIGLGCNVGNFYTFNTARFSVKETLSEKYVLAADRGTIGLIASSHFGIVHYLDISNTRQYKAITNSSYGKSVGQIMQETISETFAYTTQDDFYARAQCEETSLHGDPAVTLNPHSKPDYVIEDPLLKINPGFISVADNSFVVEAKFLNIGKAVNQDIVVQLKREFPDKTTQIIYRDTIPGIRFADSVRITVPINPIRDKGSNKLTITIDADNGVDELFETNNTITKEVFIFDDEARSVFPYDFSIVSQPGTKLIASTANPLNDIQTYQMEIDTTENFNSPLKSSVTQTSGGGILEFVPGINFTDSTVYYWRVARVKETGIFNWSTASFIYLQGHSSGFNQSHLYQHVKSLTTGIKIDSTAEWHYGATPNNLFMRNGVFPTAASNASDFGVTVNGDPYIRSVCGISNIIVHVFDPITFKPWKNANSGQPGLYGSDPVCGVDRIYNFQFNILDTAKRHSLINFLDFIPSGHYVVVKNVSGTNPASNSYSNDWKKDTSFFGSNNSIYHRLYSQGFQEIDSFNRPRAWLFTYKKDNRFEFTPKYVFSKGILDRITLSAQYISKDTSGLILSPFIGPSKQWKDLIWSGKSLEIPTADSVEFSVLGIRDNGSLDVLAENININSKNFDLSAIDPVQYRYLQLAMKSSDAARQTPYQLSFWRVTYAPAPEGSVAANVFYSPLKDSLEVGEPTGFKIAFKNVSDVNFDSLKLKVVLTDVNNVPHILLEERRKPLIAGDTIHLDVSIDSKKFAGFNSLLVDFNPDNDQPEQYRFNNFVYQNLYVKGDTLNPLMDVTFDNTHILNGDIVSSKPDILIKLKDEARWLLLNDTSVAKIQVRYPDGTLRQFNFNSDTLRFTPAQEAPSTDNTASINFKPFFEADGDYELIVSGKDKSSNVAGSMEYKVGFQVINKAMISNMLNYPNPFTTSTAFVFTITGAEVPQNIKIQILTVTGKIVREITKDELGPLHVGRNITEFKWNGTDQYGQKLANGIYLYRVVTNLNGKSLDKYKSENDDTDKYFNKGYGKMYLMR